MSTCLIACVNLYTFIIPCKACCLLIMSGTAGSNETEIMQHEAFYIGVRYNKTSMKYSESSDMKFTVLIVRASDKHCQLNKVSFSFILPPIIISEMKTWGGKVHLVAPINFLSLFLSAITTFPHAQRYFSFSPYKRNLTSDKCQLEDGKKRLILKLITNNCRSCKDIWVYFQTTK